MTTWSSGGGAQGGASTCSSAGGTRAGASKPKRETDFPHVFLSEQDEKLLFDLSVKLKFSDLVTVRDTCRELRTRLGDFPPQVFVQRPHIVEALGCVLSGSLGDCRDTLVVVFECLLVLQRGLLLACYQNFALGFDDLWLPDITFPKMFVKKFNEAATFRVGFPHFHRVGVLLILPSVCRWWRFFPD